MAKHMTIRALLCIAISRGWRLHQLDAFLTGESQETVAGSDQTNPHIACRLRDRAPRAWFQSLTKFLSNLGFLPSHADSSLFLFRQFGSLILLLICSDDVAIITGNDPSSITLLIKRLSHELRFRNSGELRSFHGIEVIHHSFGIILSQESYFRDILRSASMETCSVFSTPLSAGLRLSKTSGTPLSSSDTQLYRRLCTSLHRATLTRPDLSFAAYQLSQFMNCPTNVHLHALKRVLRYLKGTVTLGLLITHDTLTSVIAFSDADFPVDRRSTGGYLIFLGKNLIGWFSGKQTAVSRSAKEAEFKAVADVCVELEWLKSLLQELGVFLPRSPHVWCDNDGAVQIPADLSFRPRTRDIGVDFEYVRFLVLHRFVTLSGLSTSDQVADILTKPLAPTWFVHFRDKLRLISVPSPACDGGAP